MFRKLYLADIVRHSVKVIEFTRFARKEICG